MKKEIKIPPLGESISEVTIGSILKPTGTQVVQDEEVIEIETDKLNQVLYAPDEGTITFIVKQGDKVQVGDVIGSIDVKKSEKPPERQEPKQLPSHVSEKKREWLSELEEKEPEVKKEAPKDIKKPLSSLKKAMAKRLLDVSQTTAMLTTFNEVDMKEVIKLKEQYKEAFLAKYKTKLGFMSFFVKACASALKAYPEVNSYIDRDMQVFRSKIDISVAVSTEKGLIVPVIKDADQLSFSQIEEAIDGFTRRAKEGSLTVDELKGGGFTITNGGLFGSLFSTPILNPPQCAILGMHKITKRAVVVDDQIVIRPMMYLALSYDHQVLDGKQAVSFLVHIKNMIEDPHRLELGI